MFFIAKGSSQNHALPFVLFLWLCCTTCGILVPWLGSEPRLPAVKVMNSNHWSAMEFPISHFLISGVYSMLQTGKSLHINLDFYNHDKLEDHRLVLYNIYYGVFCLIFLHDENQVMNLWPLQKRRDTVFLLHPVTSYWLQFTLFLIVFTVGLPYWWFSNSQIQSTKDRK